MTTDELIRELIGEIRKDRADRAALAVKVENCTNAVAALAGDLYDFRKLAFEGERSLMKQVRAVADFVGMTDPHDSNGGG